VDAVARGWFWAAAAMTIARSHPRRKHETTGALDRIGAKLDELPAARRKAIQAELAKIDRRATYGGGKRGPKPKHGETMSEAVLVKMTAGLKAEMAAPAKRRGLASIAEYVRELHRRQMQARVKA
jgi:hypothetical protein